VLVDDPTALRRSRKSIERAVLAGATVVLLELEAGRYAVAGAEVEVRPTGMSEFFFVSRASDHPLVDGFGERDFFMWYDPARDCIMPILRSVLTAPEWDPILGSGIVSWGSEGGPALAAAERKVGTGVYRICQVRLAPFLSNPVARLFATRLLGLEEAGR
jgi:hypothetical protein